MDQTNWKKLYPIEAVLVPSLKAGALSGGRANIIPGMIMFSLFGFAGQHVYNALDARHNNSQDSLPIATTKSEMTTSIIGHNEEPPDTYPVEPLWKRVLNTKWSPMKVLSNEQYEKMLREKLVKVEAELAIVEEDIEKVKRRKGNVNQEGRDGVE
ncbi:MAG: hypothetical protein Q9209_006363 [Squamulea sp. 1 TL-2023]